MVCVRPMANGPSTLNHVPMVLLIRWVLVGHGSLADPANKVYVLFGEMHTIISFTELYICTEIYIFMTSNLVGSNCDVIFLVSTNQ